MGDALAQHLDGEVVGLEQVAVATAAAVGQHLRPQPFGAVCRLALGDELRLLLLRVQLRAHGVAERTVSREMDGVWSC